MFLDFENRFFRLTQTEKSLYVTGIHSVNQAEVGEVSFLFFGFLGQDVAFESMLSLDLSGACKGKPFLGSGVCFNLWHFCKIIN